LLFLLNGDIFIHMRPVYIISGGITKFAKAHSEKDFRLMVKEAFDYAMRDVPGLTKDMIDGSICSYFSDHFTRQLKAGAMVQDYLGGSAFRRHGRPLPPEGWRCVLDSVLKQ
jgi:acetyl-CoA acetyltransferase